MQIAKILDELGVDRIEAGMPVVSKEDKEAVELIVKACLRAEIWEFCRAVKGDIDACIDVGVNHIIETNSEVSWKRSFKFHSLGYVSIPLPTGRDEKCYSSRVICSELEYLLR